MKRLRKNVNFAKKGQNVPKRYQKLADSDKILQTKHELRQKVASNEKKETKRGQKLQKIHIFFKKVQI